MKKKEHIVICQSLMGTFNVYNTLAAISLAHSLGVSFECCVQSIAGFSGTPGRFERYNLPNGAICFIDNAHNPSSFRAALSALRKTTDHLIVVFGAGGSRDAKKRPDMGAIAAHYADHIILTSDNPRFEDPMVIINTIRVGIDAEHQNKVMAEPDRENAIRKAYALSKKGSVIVLLGKGSAAYQIFGKRKVHFSEQEILRSLSGFIGE